MLPHPEVATAGQLDLLRALGEGLPGGVVFGGGTALALCFLGHRRSFDLDFFTCDRDAFQNGARAIPSAVRGIGWSATPISSSPAMIVYRADSGTERVKLDLLLDTLPVLDAARRFPGLPVAVMSPRDIALRKVVAITERLELDRIKDAIDLCALSRSHGLRPADLVGFVPDLLASAVAEALLGAVTDEAWQIAGELLLTDLAQSQLQMWAEQEARALL